MRIKKVKTKNTTQYSIIMDVTINGKRTTKIYENLGTIEKIKLRSGNLDPLLWLDDYVASLNAKHKLNTLPIVITKYQDRLIKKDTTLTFNIGYLFLQKIYYDLGLHKICNMISDKYRFNYDLNTILSCLVYSRIIFPTSKHKTHKLAKSFIEQPIFDYNHILRGLEVLHKESNYIQSELYKNTATYANRNNRVLYYDCTNFFFEIEEEDELRKYGKSKENRPNPIVQMGLFMDGDGIPLAFNITPGNTNEQVTLKPLEEKIIEDFNTSKFVVCTDAGLASTANRKFNNTNNRKFITTQSIKKLKGFLKEWSIDLSSGWKLWGSDETYDISKLREDDELIKKYKNNTFYKERWIKENDLEQRLIITYSVKCQEYQRKIREKQIQRAKKLVASGIKKLGKVNANDPKRFISVTTTTKDGEIANETYYKINEDIITKEAAYDGLYAVCTNLEDSVEEIIKINHRRWEIEESFRIMKSEFKARPLYLAREDRIEAHFTTCFIALVLYRYLEKKLEERYTTIDIIDTLRDMTMYKQTGNAYSPSYTRSDVTDALHDAYGFRTDYEVITKKNMNKIIRMTKK